MLRETRHTASHKKSNILAGRSVAMPPWCGRGKSGQRRAPCRLTAWWQQCYVTGTETSRRKGNGGRAPWPQASTGPRHPTATHASALPPGYTPGAPTGAVCLNAPPSACESAAQDSQSPLPPGACYRNPAFPLGQGNAAAVRKETASDVLTHGSGACKGEGGSQARTEPPGFCTDSA